MLAKGAQPQPVGYLCVCYLLCVLAVRVCWLLVCIDCSLCALCVLAVCVCCCYALAGRSVGYSMFKAHGGGVAPAVLPTN